MKLRNKKTGEIIDVDFIYPETSEFFYPNFKLVDFYDLFEDYEEPKEYWTIDWTCIGVTTNKYSGDDVDNFNKSIGNYFDTKEEAEKAVEKLKAWKRLKDKGFRFEYYDYSDRDLHNHIQIEAITNREVEDSMLYKEDLDLLFGGEE